jgi:hypothetical protein
MENASHADRLKERLKNLKEKVSNPYTSKHSHKYWDIQILTKEQADEEIERQRDSDKAADSKLERGYEKFGKRKDQGSSSRDAAKKSKIVETADTKTPLKTLDNTLEVEKTPVKAVDKDPSTMNEEEFAAALRKSFNLPPL